MAGKLGRQGVVSSVRPGRRFYILHHVLELGVGPSGPSLASADGRRIPCCWDQQSFTVSVVEFLGGETFSSIGQLPHPQGSLFAAPQLVSVCGQPEAASHCHSVTHH